MERNNGKPQNKRHKPRQIHFRAQKIESTMVYINLEQATFLADTDEWITKVSHNLEEETKLIEANFTLVRSINETTALYKKRK